MLLFTLLPALNSIWIGMLFLYLLDWARGGSELRYLRVYEETYKSLRSRGIRFPDRDGESLAPIFTPPRLTTAPEPNASLAQQMYNEVI
ncbi:hypothetical protein ACET3Z_029544 [Daucus carota]